ncbi:hypothetical protein ACFVUH_20290 [Kitasatospora sp. NPDC058032]|uniref:hypothetical protein n=1 Tax=Kitasatospora sp. NPDC058032 TaxID=3346307 RepID=UPI0036DF7998
MNNANTNRPANRSCDDVRGTSGFRTAASLSGGTPEATARAIVSASSLSAARTAATAWSRSPTTKTSAIGAELHAHAHWAEAGNRHEALMRLKQATRPDAAQEQAA